MKLMLIHCNGAGLDHYHQLQNFHKISCVSTMDPRFRRIHKCKAQLTGEEREKLVEELLAKARKSSVGPAPSSLRGTSATPHGHLGDGSCTVFFPKEWVVVS